MIAIPAHTCTLWRGTFARSRAERRVGKTTTAVNVGAALQEKGHDVVVVDADLGMANLGAMLGIDHATSLHEILAGDAAVSEALTDAPGGLTIIPGEQSLDAFADADPAKLRQVIKTLRNAYDVVMIDTGAGLSHEVAVPLGLADGIILVTTPDDVAVGDTVKTPWLADRIDRGGRWRRPQPGDPPHRRRRDPGPAWLPVARRRPRRPEGD